MMKPTSHKIFSFIILLLFLAGLACRTSATPEGPNPLITEIHVVPYTPTAEPEGNQVPTPSFDSTPPPSAGTSPVESIYDENITAPPVEPIVVSELELLLEALYLLDRTDWNGDSDTPLPISIQDFDQAKLEAYIADEASDDQGLTIPADMEALYISPEAADEISDLILQARAEYMAYLASQGALSQYIDEIDQNVMPADPARLAYHPENDPNAPPTAIEGLVIDADGKKDYSRLQMDVYAVDIYNEAMSLQESGILSAEPLDTDERLAYWRQFRDMALRYLIYHEMTHVLQRAYINLHVSDENRTTKSSWIYASRRLFDVDTQYHWSWGGGSIADVNNRHTSDESQADGIAYEILVTTYGMSQQQRQAVWDRFFGRFSLARQTMAEIRRLCEERYPDFSPDEFSDLLYDVVQEYPDREGRHALADITLRLSALPAYNGYFNPMLPQDTIKVWDALRQP